MPVSSHELKCHEYEISYIVSNGNSLDEFMALPDTLRGQLYPVALDLFGRAKLHLEQLKNLAPDVLTEVLEHAYGISYIVSNGNALDEFMALPDTVRERLYPVARELFDDAKLSLAQAAYLAPDVLTEVLEHSFDIAHIVGNGLSLDEFMALPDTLRGQLYLFAWDLFGYAKLSLAQMADLAPDVLTEVLEHVSEICYIVSNGNSLNEFMALPDALRRQLYPVAETLFGYAKLSLAQVADLAPDVLTEVLEHHNAFFLLIVRRVPLEYFLTLKPSVRSEYYTCPNFYIGDICRMFPDHTNPAKIAEIMRVATILSEGARQNPKPKENGEIPCSLYNLPTEALAKIAAYCGSSDHVNGFAAQALADRCFNLKNTHSAS